MPAYEYQCQNGHVTTLVRRMSEARPKTTKCAKCPKRATRFYSPAGVIPDFPSHYNISMGCVVKNRAHHKQLQKERGLQDWEPCRNSPGSQLVKERLG